MDHARSGKASELEPLSGLSRGPMSREERFVKKSPAIQERAERKPLFLSAVSLGLGESVLVAFDPPAALMALVLGVALSLGILATFGIGSAKAAGRVIATTRWRPRHDDRPSCTVVDLGARWTELLSTSLWERAPGPYTNVGWGTLLRLAPGPIGGTPLVWGLLIAAGLPIFIGRRWRLSWAGRMWVCALVTWVACLCVRAGVVGVRHRPACTVPADSGVRTRCQHGPRSDCLHARSSGISIRLEASISALAGCAAVVGALPVLAATGAGRFDLPGTGLLPGAFLDGVGSRPFELGSRVVGRRSSDARKGMAAQHGS